MTLHVNKETLAEWREYFGENLEEAVNAAIKVVQSREVGDSLDIHIRFRPKLKPTKFSIRHDAPKCSGDSYIYVIAE